jgi:hypothetical protein
VASGLGLPVKPFSIVALCPVPMSISPVAVMLFSVGD